MRTYLYLILLSLGCQPMQATPELQRAGEVHLQALALAAQVKAALDSLEAGQYLPADSLTGLKQALEEWEQNLVEVPGLGHGHDHGHEHHGHDEPQPNVSDAELLQIQEDALARLQTIQARLRH